MSETKNGNKNEDKKLKKVLESLSPNERRILPHLTLGKVTEICKRSNLDKVSVLRAIDYLSNKGIIKISRKTEKIVSLDTNGIFYRKKGLPERRLLDLLNEKRIISIDDAKKETNLLEDEFEASLGILKRKNFIEIKKGKIFLIANKEEIAKKTEEEIFLENLPLNYDSLSDEQTRVLKALQKRKKIVSIKEAKKVEIELTDFGKKVLMYNVKDKNLIEQITPEILKNSSWKGKNFRRYEVELPVPKIYGGKRHFVSQATDYARKIWTQMGFKEMKGDLIVSSFWNFDALFTPQDHSVREMQDTFFLNLEEEIEDKKLLEKVKESHEKGVDGGSGWKYLWKEEEAKKLILRTHTTCLSAQTLSKINKEDLPQKFFAIGKCFRNETLDWSHGFEFNQTEGIVVDRNANFRHLLGYLKEFFRKMGFEKIRFRPSYFPYTEPSVEIDVWVPEKKVWLELGGAGIFRPEVVIPLLGEKITVLAWGPGFDRMLMNYYNIKDLRELYKNNINQLRKIKFWLK
ncbi:MAG: phenylalanine--tRNA ligase subunit alpha [Candidatus Pacearchaeota archaeon]|nr:MAG: phenylalanine--tRNA ligase subunit alpha [Candidatus Pacearchaeota archaeon]